MKGKELKEIRSQLGLTQQQLADKIGTTKNTVYRWEKDRMVIREPTANLLRLLIQISPTRKKAK